jgi:hypothetical protein
MRLLGLAFKALFALLAILIGASLITWIVYNEFVHRLPEYKRPPLAGPLGIAPAMIGVGLYWAKQVIERVRTPPVL